MTSLKSVKKETKTRPAKFAIWVLLLSMLSTVLFGCSSSASIPFPTLPTRFDSSQRVEQALETLDDLSDEQADLIHSVPAAEKLLALTFDGFASSEVLEGVLELLENYDVSATFFLTAVGVAEDEGLVKKMVRAGHRVESGTLHSLPNMEEMSSESLVRDFAKSSSIIEEATGRAPRLLKCFSTSYTGDVLKAALASGFKSAVKSSSLVSYQSFTSYSQVLNHINSLEWGSILSVKLSGVLTDDEYAPATQIKDEYDPGEPMPSIDEGKAAEELSDEEKLLRTVKWILTAIDETGKKTVYVEDLPLLTQFSMDKNARHEHFSKLRVENAGSLAKKVDIVHTTEKAAALTFYGISDSAALDNLLKELESLGILGTFFISVDDINDHSGAIEKISARGHHLAAAVIPGRGLDYYSACEQIFFIKNWLEIIHNQELHLVSQIFNDLEPDVQEAASAMGLYLVGATNSLTSSGTEQAEQAAPLMEGYFRSSQNTIMRGSILHIRADFYKKSDTMPAQLVRIIAGEYALNSAYTADGSDPKDTGYMIKPLYDILTNDKHTYTYPVANEGMLPQVADAIHKGYLSGMSESEIFSYMRLRYIGNPDVSSKNQIPGFSAAQVRQLDTVGKIDTGKNNTVFLTFDDWGTDKTAAQILTVLEKHGVKATFFIRTGNVSENPNLLRAIGAQGHEIASHSHQHLPLSNESDKKNVFLTLSDEEAQALEDDIILSYEVLQSIVGDMVNENGDPVLSRAFRPPTLAVSRAGLTAVLDSGYSHIVSGDFSPGDFSSQSADELFYQLTNGIKLSWTNSRRVISKGSIVVLHISDTSEYTPEALDMFLEWNAGRPESERFTFARISDYIR